VQPTPKPLLIGGSLARTAISFRFERTAGRWLRAWLFA
jgi:hypothetical protein